jgi:hypothetical protein
VGLLNLLQAGTDGVGLQLNGEDGIANGGLVEEVVDRHGGRSVWVVVAGGECAPRSIERVRLYIVQCWTRPSFGAFVGVGGVGRDAGAIVRLDRRAQHRNFLTFRPQQKWKSELRRPEVGRPGCIDSSRILDRGNVPAYKLLYVYKVKHSFPVLLSID